MILQFFKSSEKIKIKLLISMCKQYFISYEQTLILESDFTFWQFSNAGYHVLLNKGNPNKKEL